MGDSLELVGDCDCEFEKEGGREARNSFKSTIWTHQSEKRFLSGIDVISRVPLLINNLTACQTYN